MQEKLILSGSMRSGKPYGCRALGLLSKESLQKTVTLGHTSTLYWMVGPVQSSLCNVSIVMV
jgi:hypothetical protein